MPAVRLQERWSCCAWSRGHGDVEKSFGPASAPLSTFLPLHLPSASFAGQQLLSIGTGQVAIYWLHWRVQRLDAGWTWRFDG